ncbi:MAG: APC family permease [Planctomycetota bacterium]
MIEPADRSQTPKRQARGEGSGVRVLGLPALTGLVVASMIGAGVFTTSGYALADLRHPGLVMLAWLIGAAVAGCGAVSYGLLARHLTENGGEYVMLARLVHPGVGFVAGWVSLLAGFTGATAFAAVAFEAYVLPDAARPSWLPANMLAVTLIVLCTLPHTRHTTRGARLQAGAIVAKVALLVVFLGWAAARPARWHFGSLPPAEDPTPWALGLASAVMWVSLSFSGFNAAVYVAGEARNAGRMVPRAMALATGLVAVIYLLLNAVFVFGPPAEAVAGRPDVAAVAAQHFGGPWLAGLVRLTVGVALATSVSSLAMAGPRVYAAMAADGLFPRRFEMRGTPPTRAIALQAALSIVAVLLGDLRGLLGYLGLTLSLSSMATVASLWRLRSVSATPPGRFPWWPLAPMFYLSTTLLLALLVAWQRPSEALAATATLVSGAALFWVIRRETNEPKA